MKKLEDLKFEAIVLTEKEMKQITGGGINCDTVVADANANSKKWTDAEWDAWAQSYDEYCL
ncbi:MAG: bacteriocin [Bacteroides sp.]|nr:bacteriocin [Bacteroides sp.]